MPDSTVMEVRYEVPSQFIDGVLRRARAMPLPPGTWVPAMTQLGDLLREALAASLGQEEGHRAIFVVRLEPEATAQNRAVAPDWFGTNPDPYFRLEQPLAVRADALLRLFSGTQPGTSAIRVGPKHDTSLESVYIWGIDPMVTGLANQGPALRIEVLGPGRLTIKALHVTLGCIAEGRAFFLDDAMLGKPLGMILAEGGRLGPSEERIHNVVRAISSHGRGGTLLILGEGESVTGVEHKYVVDKATELFAHLDADLAAADKRFTAECAASGALAGSALLADAAHRLGITANFARNREGRYVATLARLTAVDGATLVDQNCELIEFGAKIVLDTEATVFRRSSVQESQFEKVCLADLGGTRHQSAARFVAANHNSRAFVASQDGKLSLLQARSGSVQIVEHLEWLQ